jgi:uncharacterized cupredoxin-like copper-binding protein
MQFQVRHLATLSKYAGISFIAGAVNHGMFSEQRSVITAALGVLFFLIGAYAAARSQGEKVVSWGDVIGFGIVASIGLGFFTGGLQHFPDTPGRSVWVVPLGFFLSLISLHFGHSGERGSAKAMLLYALGGGAVVVAACVAALGFFSGAPQHDHGHDDGGAHHLAQEPAPDTPASTAPASPPAADHAVRTVVIDMDDSFRFTPAHWEAKEGEALRLVVINSGKARHELVIGQEKELAEHAKLMRNAPSGHHHHDNAVSVEPGQAAVLRWTFTSAGTWGMACFEPGHFEAGMAGQITVSPKHAH